MLGSTVFLEGGRTLGMTQETDGVKLLAVESPWSIRVSHKGKEYVVPIGQRPNEGIFRPLGSASLPSGITVVRDDANAAASGPGAAPSAGSGSTNAPGATPARTGSALPSPVTRPAVDPAPPPAPAGTGAEPAAPSPPGADAPSDDPAPGSDEPPTGAPEAAVPMPLNRATVSRMDMATAREALAAIAAARARNDLDEALRNRLETEEQWVVDRIAQLGG